MIEIKNVFDNDYLDLEDWIPNGKVRELLALLNQEKGVQFPSESDIHHYINTQFEEIFTSIDNLKTSVEVLKASLTDSITERVSNSKSSAQKLKQCYDIDELMGILASNGSIPNIEGKLSGFFDKKYVNDQALTELCRVVSEKSLESGMFSRVNEKIKEFERAFQVQLQELTIAENQRNEKTRNLLKNVEDQLVACQFSNVREQPNQKMISSLNYPRNVIFDDGYRKAASLSTTDPVNDYMGQNGFGNSIGQARKGKNNPLQGTIKVVGMQRTDIFKKDSRSIEIVDNANERTDNFKETKNLIKYSRSIEIVDNANGQKGYAFGPVIEQNGNVDQVIDKEPDFMSASGYFGSKKKGMENGSMHRMEELNETEIKMNRGGSEYSFSKVDR